MKSSQAHLPSFLSSLLFAVGALLLFTIGLLLAFGALLTFFQSNRIATDQIIFLAAFAFEGIILLIAAYFSFQKFLDKPAAEKDTSLSMRGWQILLCLVVAGIAILIGNQISGNKSLNWILLPVLTIPAVALPLWILLGLGARQIPLGARWQTWTVLGLGMTLVPLILLILESIVLIIALIGIIVYVVTQPELVFELQRLVEKMMLIGPNSQAAFDLVAPYLNKPLVWLGALVYFAVIIPAIEEVFKPLGVLLFARKVESSAQGFALGALGGTGFALVETFGVSGQTNEWGSLLLARVGTGLLHITTSALMGAAIILAWRECRYLRLIGTYFLTLTLHGLWNALAITYSFSSLGESLDAQSPLGAMQTPIAISMGVLAMGMFAILIVSNRKMTSSASAFDRTPHPTPADLGEE